MRNMRYKKIVMLVLCGLALMLLNSAVNKISLNSRGVVLGVAVDVTDDGKYRLTVQEVISSSGGSKEPNSYYTVEGVGETMSEAIKLVNDLSGVESAFRHTIIVLVSDKLSKKQIEYVLSFFYVDDNIIPDETLFALVEDDAQKVLNSKATSTLISSFQLRKVFSLANPRLGVNTISLRKFNVFYNEMNNTPYLPYIKLIESDKKLSEGQGDEKTPTYLYMCDTVGVLTDEGIIELDTDSTEAITLLRGDVRNGSFRIKNGDRILGYAIASIKVKRHYDSESLTITYKMQSKLRLVELIENDTVSTNVGSIRKEDYENYNNYINEKIYKLLSFMQENNTDLLRIFEGYYYDGTSKWIEENSENYLQRTKIVIKHDTVIK